MADQTRRELTRYTETRPIGPTRFIALLRGINVGGHNKVPMADLRACLTEAGFADVATYIASGNVALTAEACDPGQLSELIEDRFGLTVPVVLRSGRQLASVVEHNPFPDAVTQPKFLVVSFCSAGFDRDAVAGFDHERFEPDQLAVANDQGSASATGRPTELYVAYRDGMSKSKLDNTALERHFGVSTTGRNWSTVLKLYEMTNGS